MIKNDNLRFSQLLCCRRVVTQFLDRSGRYIRHILNIDRGRLLYAEKVEPVSQVFILDLELVVRLIEVIVVLTQLEQVVPEGHVRLQYFFDHADRTD